MYNPDKKTSCVGIISLFYNNKNYGGLLQAYALQHAVESLGYNCKQIAHIDKPTMVFKQKIRLCEIPVKIYRKVYRKCVYNAYEQERKKVDSAQLSFMDNVPHTKLVESDSIMEIEDEFDKYICGSDQLWYYGCSTDYLLDFVTEGKPRIAYAASLGVDHTPIEHFNTISPYLKKFKAISTREPYHALGLEKYCNLENVKVVPDPVLLLTDDEWRKIADYQRASNEKYIFCFLYGDNIKVRNKCLKLAKQEGIKCVYVPFLTPYTYLWDISHKTKAAFIEAPTVGEWIGLIDKAEYVVTDSYHCALFSLIFKKKLVPVDRVKMKDSRSANKRIEHVLKRLHLDGIILNELPNDIKDIKSTASASKYIQAFRNEGLAYLSENLRDDR